MGSGTVVAELVGGEAAVDGAAREGVARVEVRRELPEVGGIVEGQPRLGGARAPQFLLVARGQAQVESQGDDRPRAPRGSCSLPRITTSPRPLEVPDSEATRRSGLAPPKEWMAGGARGGEANEGGVDGRGQIDVDDGHGHPEVEAVW